MKLVTWSLAAVALLGLLFVGAAGAPVPPAPTQPIPFSHLKHAGELSISCSYCHTNARRSPVAGLPTVKRCMGCHELVATDLEGVQTLAGYWDRKEPIPWQKVYDLPDHTKFFHDRHIKRGIDCAVCHGAVRTMEKVRQVRPLQMGWCIDCHRQRDASVDCLTCHY
ncbi:MAG: cytochrome c3 family protein [Acidobacteriota bacterium]